MKNVIGVVGASGRLGIEILCLAQEMHFQIVSTSSRHGSSHTHLNLLKKLNHQELDAIFGHCNSIVYLPGIRENLNLLDMGRSILDRVNYKALGELAYWALLRRKHLIFTSGAIVYRDVSQHLLKEECEVGISGISIPYAWTKIKAEKLLTDLISKGLNCTIIRPSSIFGGHPLNKGMIEKLVTDSIDSSEIEIYPPLSQRVGFVHVKEVASCILFAIENRIFQTLNISSLETPSVLQIAQVLAWCSKKRIKILPNKYTGIQSKDRFLLSSQKLLDLGWTPMRSLEAYIEYEYRQELEKSL